MRLKEVATNTKMAENCVRFSLPKLINNLDDELFVLFSETSLTTFKMKTKKLLIHMYSNSNCTLLNCFPCSRRLFFPNYLPYMFQLLSIFSYYRITTCNRLGLRNFLIWGTCEILTKFIYKNIGFDRDYLCRPVVAPGGPLMKPYYFALF